MATSMLSRTEAVLQVLMRNARKQLGAAGGEGAAAAGGVELPNGSSAAAGAEAASNGADTSAQAASGRRDPGLQFYDEVTMCTDRPLSSGHQLATAA
jgi:hypothetical protein